MNMRRLAVHACLSTRSIARPTVTENYKTTTSFKVRDGGDGSAELNSVRRRVGMPSRPATLYNILQERLLELMWEGCRRPDLIRFGRFGQSYDIRQALPNEDTGYTTVFPIPTKAINLNGNLRGNGAKQKVFCPKNRY